MLEQLTKLLEQYNVPTDIIVDIKEKLSDGFQLDDVIQLISENKDKIENQDELIQKLNDMGGASGIINSLKDGEAGDALNKAKGMLGL